jgi:hypothetical protein
VLCSMIASVDSAELLLLLDLQFGLESVCGGWGLLLILMEGMIYDG